MMARVVWIGTMLACCVSTTAAQQPTRLAGPAARLSHEFSRITSVRELPDGRLLVVDAVDRVLYVADFGRDLVRQVGREGQGPGEYGRLGALLPLPGDSTLLVDLGGARYLLLQRDSIVVTVPPNSPAHLAGATLPIGTDGTGRVIATRAMASPASRDPMAMPGRIDSLHLIRVHRATGASDTIATLRARESRIVVSGRGSAMTTQITFSPLATGDVALSLPDGWVAIARMDPYRVDWITPDGRLTTGPRLPFDRRSPSLAEKRAAMERLAATRGTAAADPSTRDDWPEVTPPFLPGALLAGPNGTVWVRRVPDAAARTVSYDVIDRSGTRVASVVVPESDHVAGVGREWVYVIHTNDDGIQQLRRHPVPR